MVDGDVEVPVLRRVDDLLVFPPFHLPGETKEGVKKIEVRFELHHIVQWKVTGLIWEVYISNNKFKQTRMVKVLLVFFFFLFAVVILAAVC